MTIFQNFVTRYRNNRKILLLIVYVALFLDNMLLTTVVPIVPEYLLRLNHPNLKDQFLYNQIQAPSTYNLSRLKRELNDTYQEKTSEMSPFLSTIKDTLTHMGSTPVFENKRQNYLAKVNQRRHETLSEENVQVGLMFGSKALVQLIVNPMVGPLTEKVGYTIPMFGGFVIMFVSTLFFAFGSSYGVLCFARALQGVGSACTSTSGMGMLAQAYPDDAERGSAMGIALGGLALGVLLGPPYGGALYQWAGKTLPFVLLAILALMDGSLQYVVLQPKVARGKSEGPGLIQLVKDPYILVAAGTITIGNLGIAILEPSLPLWMMESWDASSIERGAAFLPASISYLIGTNIFGPLAHKIGRCLSGFIGLITIGFCLLAIPSAKSIAGLILPNFFMGFSIGMIDASMFPLMGYIVDLRYAGVYGSIYAIADAAFCLAFALGPFVSGPIVRTFGFPVMMYTIAAINFIYAPLMFFLRYLPKTTNDAEKQESKPNAVSTNKVSDMASNQTSRVYSSSTINVALA